MGYGDKYISTTSSLDSRFSFPAPRSSLLVTPVSVLVRRASALSFLLALTISSLAWPAEPIPVKPSSKDKCPVCGMFVAKYPDFLAEILYKDGSYVFFDGAKDLFKYLLHLKKYHPSRNSGDIVKIFVNDYYELKLIDGKDAVFVIGSDIYGPMGRELIPFAKESDAREFLKDHKGKALLRFEEVTPEILQGMD